MALLQSSIVIQTLSCATMRGTRGRLQTLLCGLMVGCPLLANAADWVPSILAQAPYCFRL